MSSTFESVIQHLLADVLVDVLLRGERRILRLYAKDRINEKIMGHTSDATKKKR